MRYFIAENTYDKILYDNIIGRLYKNIQRDTSDVIQLYHIDVKKTLKCQKKTAYLLDLFSPVHC